MIELRHLRYVVAASKCGSFRRAAVSLGVEQSTISRHIRDLEDELGASLFNRYSGGVILTHAGKRFVRHARRALSEVSCAAADIRPIGRGEEGAVQIGIFSSLASGFLAQMLRAYIHRYSDVRIDIIEGSPSEHISAVRQHKLDVAFVTGAPGLTDCDAAQFWTERVFVVIPDAHPLAERKVIRWDELRTETFILSEGDPGPEIHDFLIKHLADLGAHPAIERHRVGRDNLMQIVSFGRGLTLTSESTVATQFPGVVYRRLENEMLPFCAVWSPNNDNPAWRRMLSLARLLARRNGICDSERIKTSPTPPVSMRSSSHAALSALSQSRDLSS
ncbi:LysR family transcriptional regulator [Aestuariivita sp.]|jgi:DNA-binding transcriptional LysR family regulator|uniref:LysR substrate-binding domain-containing protein n=1 Tax=Aestuariivita sp. TaxID=1872407 RepID=UPI0021728955|nr:LysR family transcriptional regulator [Aestuariivita sp.]MCE8008251.1 LysR family transcriptional regulator [Aestuariivita sp.]